MDALSQAISKIGVVPVIKLNHPERDAAALGKALCAGGVPVAEVTFRASGADKAIRLMKEACPDMIVGAGTVTTTEQIDAALAAGAQFIVSPGFDADLVAYAQKKRRPRLSGLHDAYRLSRRLEIRAGSPEVLPRRAVRRTGENQGHERPVPTVQGYAHGRHILFTGITPALGSNVVEICREACKAAKARNIKISCDLNYRGKLWTREEARAAMTDLCQYVDVCISNEEDAKDVFGIEAVSTDITAGELNKEGYKSVAKQLADKFHFEKVAITLRESKSAFDNDWSAMLYDAASGEYCFSKLYHLHIIDRIGGGDSFGGGLIYSLLSGKSAQDAVEFAVAASALKHSIEGDYNFVTVAEVEKLAGGDASGRVQR